MAITPLFAPNVHRINLQDNDRCPSCQVGTFHIAIYCNEQNVALDRHLIKHITTVHQFTPCQLHHPCMEWDSKRKKLEDQKQDVHIPRLIKGHLILQSFHLFKYYLELAYIGLISGSTSSSSLSFISFFSLSLPPCCTPADTKLIPPLKTRGLVLPWPPPKEGGAVS